MPQCACAVQQLFDVDKGSARNAPARSLGRSAIAGNPLGEPLGNFDVPVVAGVVAAASATLEWELEFIKLHRRHHPPQDGRTDGRTDLVANSGSFDVCRTENKTTAQYLAHEKERDT